MKYFLHAMVFFYYVTFWDTITQGIGMGSYGKILESPLSYSGTILFHIWLSLLWIVFAKSIGNDKWLKRALVFYWIPAFVYLILRSYL